MRKLHLFTVPQGEKVTEKHLRRVLISSVFCMLYCLTCLVSTTWALFTTTVESAGNVIQMGTFEPTFEVSGVAAVDGVYSLSANGEYFVGIHYGGDVRGYCLITFKQGNTELASYVTKSLPLTQTASASAEPDLSVTVRVGAEPVSMIITPVWGPYRSSVVQDDVIPDGNVISVPSADP